MAIFTTLVLLVLDLYIYKALRATTIKWTRSSRFSWIWWGYSALLTTGVFISIYASIPLMLRSIILVAFFITFCTKFIFMLVLVLDDIRRGGIWVRRLIAPKKAKPVHEPVLQQRESATPLEAPLPEQPVKGIKRSEFLTKAGILIASAPMVPMAWGVISGAYDYRVRREKLYLPNLPKAFDGMKIGQLSDIHSGSFYNKRAVQGGVELLLAEKPDTVFFTGDLVNHRGNEMRAS